MCGIVSVIQFDSDVDREIRQKALRILFSETMLQTESRGKDATGIYQVHQDGDWLMVKKGKKVTEWLGERRTGEKDEDPIDYQEIVESWLDHPKDVSAIVGHCRAATVGSKGKDNNDNHPFSVQLDEENVILGIHNGTLTNHEVIFDRLPDLLPRQGKVDSESLFHFLYHLTDKGTKPVDEDMLKYMGERVEGAYAVIAMNTRFPDQIVTFRKDRPMEYFMVAPLNIVVIASEKKFFEHALETYEFARRFLPGYQNLPDLVVGNRNLLDREYRIFDRSAKWPEGRPIHGDFDKISEKGDMTKISGNILEEWRGPEKNANKSQYGTTYHGGTSGTNKTGGVKTTKKDDAKSVQNQISTTIKPADDDVTAVEGTVIEVPIGMDDASTKAIEQVRGLGLIVSYDTMKELATSIGVREVELDKMNGLELANKLSCLHFSIGHAVARLSAQSEVAEMRTKASTNTLLLESTTRKQKNAESHIWEHRQLVTIIRALARGKYELSVKNVEIALAAFSQLNKDKRKSIVSSAKSILECGDAEKLIKQLLATFKQAETREKASAASNKAHKAD